MNGKILSPVFIISSLLLLVSCTSPPTTATIPPVPTTPTPLPPPISPDFPTGIFYHSHSEGGTYCVFQFNQDGTYAFYWTIATLDLSKRKPTEIGTYSVSDNLYTVTSTDATWCPPPATYTWTYDGQTLTFQVFGEDTCSDRRKTYESPLMYTHLE